jgi:hypothetical protein
VNSVEPGSGKTHRARGLQSPCFWSGPSFAEGIMASGPCAASTGRRHGRTDQRHRAPRSTLPTGSRPDMALGGRGRCGWYWRARSVPSTRQFRFCYGSSNRHCRRGGPTLDGGQCAKAAFLDGRQRLLIALRGRSWAPRFEEASRLATIPRSSGPARHQQNHAHAGVRVQPARWQHRMLEPADVSLSQVR